MNECRIYCDAYGTYVCRSECENCRMKNDCFKIRLPNCEVSVRENTHGNLNN